MSTAEGTFRWQGRGIPPEAAAAMIRDRPGIAEAEVMAGSVYVRGTAGAVGAIEIDGYTWHPARVVSRGELPRGAL
jgi:hypothetical protein